MTEATPSPPIAGCIIVRKDEYLEALALLREAGKSLWGGVAFDRDVVVDLSARIDAFLAKEKGNG